MTRAKPVCSCTARGKQAECWCAGLCCDLVIDHRRLLMHAFPQRWIDAGLFDPEAEALPPTFAGAVEELAPEDRLRRAVEALQSYRRLQGEGRYEEAGRELKRLEELLEPELTRRSPSSSALPSDVHRSLGA